MWANLAYTVHSFPDSSSAVDAMVRPRAGKVDDASASNFQVRFYNLQYREMVESCMFFP